MQPNSFKMFCGNEGGCQQLKELQGFNHPEMWVGLSSPTTADHKSPLQPLGEAFLA